MHPLEKYLKNNLRLMGRGDIPLLFSHKKEKNSQPEIFTYLFFFFFSWQMFFEKNKELKNYFS